MRFQIWKDIISQAQQLKGRVRLPIELEQRNEINKILNVSRKTKVSDKLLCDNWVHKEMKISLSRLGDTF